MQRKLCSSLSVCVSIWLIIGASATHAQTLCSQTSPPCVLTGQYDNNRSGLNQAESTLNSTLSFTSAHFVPPTFVNGKVYVPTYDSGIMVYGCLQTPCQ